MAAVGANDDVAAVHSRPRPVLMIPLRRCGSHALRLRLNFNPHFYSPYPLHIVDFMPLVPLYGDLSDDRAYFRMVVDVVGLQAASPVKWSDMVFDPRQIFEAIRHERRSVHRVVWELLLRAGELHGARIVMDKSLDSVHYADELMSLFPQLLFLNVVRDPRAQVASMTRAIIHDFDATLNAKVWADAYRVALSLAERYPERVLTVRYEDFLADQESTLRKVCHFFGIEYLPQMLDVTRSHEAQQLSHMSALWASNCFAPIAANTDKFKTQLSMKEIEVIETLARDYMALYGYELMTDAQAAINDSTMMRSRQCSEIAKRRAWHDLEHNDYRDFILRRFRSDYLQQVRNRLEDLSIDVSGNAGDVVRIA